MLLGVGLVLGSGSCAKLSGPEPRVARWYHARLLSPEGTRIPFFLQLPGDCRTEEATIVNGAERIHAACHDSEAGLLIDFPVYGTQLEARFEPGGNLTGIWYRERPAGRVPLLAFEAQAISEPNPRARFVVDSENRKTDPPRADFAGIWRMEFDLYGLAKGVFTQDAWGVVRGTAEVPAEYGDLRFLAGNVRGKHLEISTFDGQHAVLLQAGIRPDGTIKGHIEGHGGLKHSWDDFVAERAESVQMPNPLDRVALRTGNQLDVDSLRGPRYAGKPVILARIDHRFGNEGDFGRPERFSESFAIDPVQVE